MDIMDDVLAQAAQIKLVIFDVDGVLTDGSIFIGDGGEEYKAFYARDGLGMSMLLRSGIKIAIITGRTSQVVVHRMRALGIEYVFQGQIKKIIAFDELRRKLDLSALEIAYVGDDIIDLPVMRQVGLAIAVADAHPLVIQHSHWQTTANAGRGAAREVCELIMLAQNKLQAQLDYYAK